MNTDEYVVTEAWESSAGHSLTELWFAGASARGSTDWVASIEDCLPTLEELGDVHDMLRPQFCYIGYTTILNNDLIQYNHVLDLVISKQKDYGHGNILKFGLLGIVVRLSDKIERLKNLMASATRPSNESLDDTKMDIVGYCILALMLLDGTFTKELANG